MWIPDNFTQRIDIQKAPGLLGGGVNTKTPIGVGISARVTELLDSSIGLDIRADKTVEIRVIHAKTDFEYSVIAPVIVYAKTDFEAEFKMGDLIWQEQFFAIETDETIGSISRTNVAESTWEKIAFEIYLSIIDKLK